MKRCSKCGETKDLSEFHKDRGNKDGLQGWCKVCRVTRPYNLTAQQYLHMMEKQNHQCAICWQTFGEGWTTKPFVDHDHKTGVVRQLLCPSCNSLIGHSHESTDILLSAVHYLQDHSHQDVTHDWQSGRQYT